ncbi:MAG: hypothetical protein AB7I48_19700 [Planctomycetaceae bacterium]
MSSRTICIVLCTETPIPIFDPRVSAVVDEILQIDGLQHGPQFPLVDSHSRDSVRSVLGSVGSLRRGEADGVPALLSVAHFAASVSDVFELYQAAHIDGFSISARRKMIERRDDGTRVVPQSEQIECSTVVNSLLKNAVARPSRP